MDLAKLRPNDRLGLSAGAVVAITGLVSVMNGWGAILVLAVLAGIGAVGVIVAPQLAPAARLPGSEGSLLALLGAVAVMAWIPPLIVWLDWIAGHLASLDTIQFLVGFIFALVLGRTGWVALQAEGGRMRLGPQTTPPADDVAGPRPGPTAPDPRGDAGADANPDR
jgi:hypothetical protein